MDLLRRCIPLLGLLLGACGTVRSAVVTAPNAPLSTAQFAFTPVTADSKEKNPDADAYNTQLKADAQQALIAMVRNRGGKWVKRSEEHTSELQSLMRNSYAVFCLQKKT